VLCTRGVRQSQTAAFCNSPTRAVASRISMSTAVAKEAGNEVWTPGNEQWSSEHQRNRHPNFGTRPNSSYDFSEELRWSRESMRDITRTTRALPPWGGECFTSSQFRPRNFSPDRIEGGSSTSGRAFVLCVTYSPVMNLTGMRCSTPLLLAIV